MDEEASKAIVDRLRAEGQLTRNTGTNSIKSMNTRLDKFSVVFDSMNVALLDQSQMLRDVLGIQKNQLELSKSEAVKLDTERKLSRAGPTDVSGSGSGTPSDTNENNKTANRSGLSGILDSIGEARTGIMAFFGASLTALSSIGIATIASRMIRAGIGIALAPIIADYVVSFAESALKDFNILGADGFSPAVSSALTSLVNWGVIGYALGGWWGAKIGLMFAAGGILWRALDSTFNLSENMQAIADGLGLNLPDGWQTAVGTAIGFALFAVLPTVIRRALLPLLAAGATRIGAAAAGSIGLSALASRLNPLRPGGRPPVVTPPAPTPPAPTPGPRPTPSGGPTPPARPGVASRIATSLRNSSVLRTTGTVLGRLATPLALLSLGNSFYEIWNRGPASSDEMEQLREDGAFEGLSENYNFDGREASHLDETAEVGLSPSQLRQQEIAEQLSGYYTTRDINSQNAGTSSAEVDTSGLDAIIMNLESELARLRREEMLDAQPAPIQPARRGRLPSFDTNRIREIQRTIMESQPSIELGSTMLQSVVREVATGASNGTNLLVFAPTTNAPVTNITQGGSSVSSQNSTNITTVGTAGSGMSGLAGYAN
jgi:hypothetical protein